MTRLYAHKGEWITCEAGHDVACFARDIMVGEAPTSDMFDLVQQPMNGSGLCRCGRPYWQPRSAADGARHSVYHIEFNWRDKTSAGAVPRRPEYADVDTLVAAEGARMAREARREYDYEDALRGPESWWRTLWMKITKTARRLTRRLRDLVT